MNLLHTKTRNKLSEDHVDKLLFIQINLRTLNRKPKACELQDKPQEQESDESASEVETDLSPYKFVPLIIQRISEDAPTAGTTALGSVQPALPGLRQLAFPEFPSI
jgi:hypothetical protein